MASSSGASSSNDNILRTLLTTRVEYIHSVSQFETVMKPYVDTGNRMHFCFATEVSADDRRVILEKIGNLGVCLNQSVSHSSTFTIHQVSLDDVLSLPVSPSYTVVLHIESNDELYNLICLLASFRCYLVGTGRYRAHIFDTHSLQPTKPTPPTEPTISITFPHQPLRTILASETVQWLCRELFALGCFHAFQGFRGFQLPAINVNFSLFSGGKEKRSESQCSTQ